MKAVKATKQINLFDNSSEESTSQNTEPSFESIKQQIDLERKRVGWSKETAISYIEDKYSVSSRQEMTIQQLIELRDYLRGLTTEKLEENFDETN